MTQTIEELEQKNISLSRKIGRMEDRILKKKRFISENRKEIERLRAQEVVKPQLKVYIKTGEPGAAFPRSGWVPDMNEYRGQILEAKPYQYEKGSVEAGIWVFRPGQFVVVEGSL